MELGGIAVVDILRVGLSGLCFLLAVLAFRLIGREQDRAGAPRRGIIRMIQVFIGTNLVAGVLCAVSGYIMKPANVSCDATLVGSYVPESTFFVVDLENWQPEGKGPVFITRTDHIRKMTSNNDDYVIPYFTTGDSIRCDPIQFSTKPLFIRNNAPELKGRVQYDYVLPVGHQPAGYTEVVSSKFTFPTGFKDSNREWWQARIVYPTKTVAVVIKFPQHKPCKDITVSLIVGDRNPERMLDAPATVSNDGRVVNWAASNQAGQRRIQFDWVW